jgi:hypothetical protein
MDDLRKSVAAGPRFRAAGGQKAAGGALGETRSLAIRTEGPGKRYGQVDALRDLSLQIAPGESAFAAHLRHAEAEMRTLGDDMAE